MHDFSAESRAFKLSVNTPLTHNKKNTPERNIKIVSSFEDGSVVFLYKK
jgi:predicted SnoaL-like aldol condensation-catalyzing enzyme